MSTLRYLSVLVAVFAGSLCWGVRERKIIDLTGPLPAGSYMLPGAEYGTFVSETRNVYALPLELTILSLEPDRIKGLDDVRLLIKLHNIGNIPYLLPISLEQQSTHQTQDTTSHTLGRKFLDFSVRVVQITTRNKDSFFVRSTFSSDRLKNSFVKLNTGESVLVKILFDPQHMSNGKWLVANSGKLELQVGCKERLIHPDAYKIDGKSNEVWSTNSKTLSVVK